MLLIENYRKKIKEFNFEEFPQIIGHKMVMLKNFLEFDKLSLEVKIHLTSLLIRRSVGVNNGIYLPEDVNWLISHFIGEYKEDLSDPSKHDAHKRAIELVTSEETFSDCIIGTTYMYTVIEYYLKYKLGYKIFPKSDEELFQNQKIRENSIGSAYLKVKKSRFRISNELNIIDKHFKERAKEMGYEREELQNIQIQGRLNQNRNMFLHGHYQYYHAEGTLLVLLFILLHYCELEESIKVVAS